MKFEISPISNISFINFIPEQDLYTYYEDILIFSSDDTAITNHDMSGLLMFMYHFFGFFPSMYGKLTKKVL